VVHQPKIIIISGIVITIVKRVLSRNIFPEIVSLN
jgi:hypothetical protein